MSTYRERLRIPFGWWLLAALFIASCGWIFLVVTTWTIAAITMGLIAIPVIWALWVYGSLTLEVRGHDIMIGPARLEPLHRGEVRALDPVELRHLMGPGADARAYLSTRPYIRTGALIVVDDESDPTPYWLISTRQPHAFVASLSQSGKDHSTAEPNGDYPVVKEN